ncbi:MAG TPA: methyltransferase domain-containing protein [Chthoniobacterales bacterium]|jgi:SAM-dependent methyltransferase|nr:methyltransferase domain-containing protein [Chthoniobacterales bacterium]
MKRQFDPAEPELMDRPQPISAELERDLRNLCQLNRWFGSYRLIGHFVRRWIEPRTHSRIADLATGSADIPRFIVDFARNIGADVEIDAVERQSATLEIARRWSRDYPEISFREADLLRFNPTKTYDVVLCSLALHHFSDADAVQVLRRCRELSHKFVLVSDLRRGWFLSVGVYLLTALIFRESMTKYDGRLSAARAFSFREMDELARQAGWQNFGHKNFRFVRQAIWLKNISEI